MPTRSRCWLRNDRRSRRSCFTPARMVKACSWKTRKLPLKNSPVISRPLPSHLLAAKRSPALLPMSLGMIWRWRCLAAPSKHISRRCCRSSRESSVRLRRFGKNPEMANAPTPTRLPDAPARLAALTDHDRTLLVEAGAGTGKTALMAGRVSLLIGAGVHPKEIVAITFTEAASSELLERIERFVQLLLGGEIPVELREALPQGITAKQHENLESGARALDEITCTTIHGFCQQLVKPYPVEAGIDPGAAIIDPAAAEIAYQDLMEAWLSSRFGRDRGAEGLGRIPPIVGAGGEEDFFTELLIKAPDETLELISKTARFLKLHRTAHAPPATADPSTFARLAQVTTEFAAWYNNCGVAEPTTADLIEDLARVATLARQATSGPLTGRHIAELLFHTPPLACKKEETAFKQWGRKGKWKEASKTAGRGAAHGDQLGATGESFYQACGAAYRDFCANLGALAFQRFVVEFDALKDLY